LHIKTVDPITGHEVIIQNVVIRAIHDDGTYDADGDGWHGRRCNPPVVKLYNADASPAAPMVPAAAPQMSADMIAALTLLLGGDGSVQ
jgi:hypothetical protein